MKSIGKIISVSDLITQIHINKAGKYDITSLLGQSGSSIIWSLRSLLLEVTYEDAI